MARYSKAEKAEALETLRKLCPPGTKVYTTLRHVSRSGMLREISLHILKKGQIVHITWNAARVLGWPVNDGRAYWALRVSGCGMDMGFHTVNTLSYALHGYKAKGEGALAENTGRPFKPRRGHFRAGYTLEHEWI